MLNFKKNVLFILFLVFGAAGEVEAQTFRATVSGQVRDNKRKLPIQYANIVVKHKNDQKFITGTITDEEGRFKLIDLVSGAYIIEISILVIIKKLRILR